MAWSAKPALSESGAARIASKESGLDIGGVSVRGDRLYLGLRRPVLRSWAIMLEIRPSQAKNNTLSLAPVGPDGRHYRKHFLQLDKAEGLCR